MKESTAAIWRSCGADEVRAEGAFPPRVPPPQASAFLPAHISLPTDWKASDGSSRCTGIPQIKCGRQFFKLPAALSSLSRLPPDPHITSQMAEFPQGYVQHLGSEKAGSFKALWRVHLIIDTSTLVLWDGATRYQEISKHRQPAAGQSSPPTETLPALEVSATQPALHAPECWGLTPPTGPQEGTFGKLGPCPPLLPQS